MRFFSRRNSEAELDAELRAYLDLLIDENLRAGMTPEAAHRSALLKLEGMAQVKERCREVRPFHCLTGFWQDVRCAFRAMRKHPGFTAVALLSLGLGIGANAAIFSLFYNALIRPLPYRNDAQLLFIGRNMDGGQPFVASPEFAGWRANIHGLEGVAARGGDDYNMTGTGAPERVHAAVVTTNFLTVLGVSPAIGRDFAAAEGHPGAPGVALLSDAMWRRLFGGSPAAVGKAVSLNNRAHTVTGILPRQFRVPGDDEVDLVVPFQGAGFSWTDRQFMILQVFGRVRPGVTLRQAAAELQAITERDRNIPPFFQHALLRNPLVLVPLRDWLVGDRRPALAALLGAVGLLLLIACVNVANLQLARATERQREIGLRAALGASRVRLARWLIVENMTLGAMAGVLGIAVAYTLTALLRHAPGFPLAGSFDLQTGWILWAATFALSAVAGLAAGLAPALAGPRLELNEILKRGALSVVGGQRAYLRPALVVTQVALALALLVGAGLLLRSMERVLSVGLGMRAENLLTLQMRLPLSRYSTVAKRDQFVDALLGNVRTLPGVESAAVTSALPMTAATNLASVLFEGQPAPPPGQRPNFALSVVTPDYFHTMGTPLMAGRNFDRNAAPAGAPQVVIVNQAFAKRFYPGDTATGKRIRLYGVPEYTTIIGVVADVRDKGRETAADPHLFVTSVQFPIPSLGLVIHTRNDPASLVPAVRAAVWSVDKEQPVYDVQTMQARVSEAGGHRRTQTILLTVFGFLAMCLAAIGIYGVVSEAVNQRTREIGVRMALGADAADVVRMVMRRSLALAVIGIAVGLGASLYLTRFLESLLFGVKASDAVTFATAGAVLLGVALLAGYLPARRASRIDPAAVLRSE